MRGDRGGGLRRRPTRPTRVPVVELVLPGDAVNRVVHGGLFEREPHERFGVGLSSVDDDRVEGDQVPIADDFRIGRALGRRCRRLDAGETRREKRDGHERGSAATSPVTNDQA